MSVNNQGTSQIQQNVQSANELSKLLQIGLQEIVESTKAMNALPSGAARDAYCAYPSFGKVIDCQSDRILGIVSKVLKHQNIKGNIQRRQQDEQFEMLLECNDLMLERINSNLDDLAGIRKNPETILVESKVSNFCLPNQNSGSWNVKNNLNMNTSARLITARNIARPQVNFNIPIDNNANVPFVPRIKEKPNSLKPLSIMPEYDEDGIIERYLNPYEFELMQFQPSASQLEMGCSIKPRSLKNTDFFIIENLSKLNDMLQDLQNENEMAVDLEHHSYRSFQGITCLMQISTKHKDYVIDALKLREDLHILNNVFTNPKILKVFHGADCDIEWLQRDLSLYIVNMFDTHQAAKILGFPRLSLAYLLKHYCDIDADKTFQLADWRIRPLPEELVSYARQDTHFLIYVYQMLRNELLLKPNGLNILKSVYQKSTEICKKTYLKPQITLESHMDMYNKSKRIFDNRQLYALKELYLWRDKIARQEDESYGYVLPNHMMLQISESLPREMQGILACCNPIPPLVRQNLRILHQIILKAREQPLVKTIINEKIVNRAVPTTTKDFNSKLYCPHDYSHDSDFRDDLPTLLGPVFEVTTLSIVNNFKPTLNIFENLYDIQNKDKVERLKTSRKLNFVSPYERYKAVIPIAEREKIEELSRKQAEDGTKLLCPIKVEENMVKCENKDNDKYSMQINVSLKRKLDQATSENSESKQCNCVEKDDNIKFSERASTSNQNETSKTNKNLKFNININNESKSQTVKNESDPNQNNRNKTSVFRKKGFKMQSSQSSNKAVDFDYSKVDFKNFKGGSQKSTEVKKKFQGTVKSKANNKMFNKLFTFGNVNKNK